MSAAVDPHTPPAVEITDEVVRSTIGFLFAIASSGDIPQTWTPEMRADAQVLLDLYEDVLIELTSGVPA